MWESEFWKALRSIADGAMGTCKERVKCETRQNAYTVDKKTVFTHGTKMSSQERDKLNRREGAQQEPWVERFSKGKN